MSILTADGEKSEVHIGPLKIRIKNKVERVVHNPFEGEFESVIGMGVET